MASTLALGGWVAAALAGGCAVQARRALSGRMEHVARACHELRGPITAARLGLALGDRSGALPPDRIRALDLELGRATLAIDDLAELRPGGRSPGTWEEVELRALLVDSVEAWRSSAEAHGVELALRWTVGPAFVFGERLRLAQATGNLIANAIEHGGGAIEVRGVLAATSVRVEFVDDGPGLPAPVAELARRGRHVRGPRGHGLAIASAVATGHCGRLAGAPTESGARLVLELPLASRNRAARLPG